MKQRFSLALAVFCQPVRLPVSILSQFSALTLTESTGISLPESVAEDLPGSSGDASVAGLNLQLVMEFVTGNFKAITLTDGITPDQKAPRHLDVVDAGSLNLCDLGYFVLDHLKALADNDEYVLCRLLLSPHLSREDGQKIDLVALLRVETRDRFEMARRLGKPHMLSCRVGFFRAPDEIANRRRQNAYKPAAPKGRPPNKFSFELMGWTSSLTNVPDSMLSLDQTGMLYVLRWPMELIFTLWKSHMKLHFISGIRKERILMEWYARLIGLGLFQFLAMPLRAKDIDLNPTKAFKR